MKKNIKLTLFISTICSVFTATSVSAQGIMTSSSDVSSIISGIINILNKIVPLLVGVAIVVFLWGVVVFIIKSSAGNAEGRKEGINFMIFGIIGIAVMVSVWGLVTFVTNSLGTGNSAVPQFNGGNAPCNPVGPNGPVPC